jgi:2-polyprenyl-3-methyl-5-hydroxy-6-metoxy-1,4-benzoquinol methylase
VWPAAASWLTGHEALLRGGRALDVACGRGRHALWLAERGYEVDAIDRDAAALMTLAEEAARRNVAVRTSQRDLEAAGATLAVQQFDLVVVVHYLHRPLMTHLCEALRPGGLLVYETFTTAQAARGKPSNPAFLLEPGELRQLVAPLQIVVEREGEFDGRCVASIVARRRPISFRLA